MTEVGEGSIAIGIDASNLRRGGGVTHLRELLRHVRPEDMQVGKVVVWADEKTLNLLEDTQWLVKRCPLVFRFGSPFRLLWQALMLGSAARSERCNVLFVPGGSFVTTFRPVVVMCRNMLMFEPRELRRFGWSLFTLKLYLLRCIQLRSFSRAAGVIYLTNYAKEAVERLLASNRGTRTEIIGHGVGRQFFRKASRDSDRDKDRPSLVYVSIVDCYKHQWNVVYAAEMVRSKGFDFSLDLIGPAEARALDMLSAAILEADPTGEWVTYHGAVPYEEIMRHYHAADAGVFASTCENMPNILLEMMASGLPIACSKCGPMPEVLGDTGWYFDAEDVSDIARAIEEMLRSRSKFDLVGAQNRRRAGTFTWDGCAERTFQFLKVVSDDKGGM